MTLVIGSLQLGFLYGILALGIYVTFRILNIPDLTAEGSFTLGLAASAVCTRSSTSPPPPRRSADPARLGAAAELGVEYTVPEVSQSLIITRLEGRTPVPAREQLEAFASHQTSMAIYLSVQRIHRVAERLVEGGYPATTPVAVIYKATWPESQTVRGTLADIGDKVRDAGIRKTALILVGPFLGDEYHYSKLYAADFSHEYRKA